MLIILNIEMYISVIAHKCTFLSHILQNKKLLHLSQIFKFESVSGNNFHDHKLTTTLLFPADSSIACMFSANIDVCMTTLCIRWAHSWAHINQVSVTAYDCLTWTSFFLWILMLFYSCTIPACQLHMHSKAIDTVCPYFCFRYNVMAKPFRVLLMNGSNSCFLLSNLPSILSTNIGFIVGTLLTSIES
jgi:hypothetical protein